MLLNMADFGKCWKSLQTFWKDSYTLANGFLSACGTICIDVRRIRWGPKLADFEQKAWAIAYAFEHGWFWQVLKIAPHFLKGILCACKWISKGLRDYLNGFRVNSLGSETGRFEQKAWAIAHAFEHGGFWQVLEIAPNFLKGLLYGCKWISNCLRDYLNGFRVNALVSELGGFWAKSLGYSPWFWAKSLGYSPCFWTWRILASVGNRSNLPERTPICLQMDF